MNRSERAWREAREDPLWGAVWQIWPQAMSFESPTPFDGRQPGRLRPVWRAARQRPHKQVRGGRS